MFMDKETKYIFIVRGINKRQCWDELHIFAFHFESHYTEQVYPIKWPVSLHSPQTVIMKFATSCADIYVSFNITSTTVTTNTNNMKQNSQLWLYFESVNI